MADVVPAGPRAVPLMALREAMAESGDIQTWLGAANATAAKAKMLIGEHDEDFGDTTMTRPYLMLRIQEGSFGKTRVSVADFVPQGTIEILIAGTIGADYQGDDPHNAMLDAETKMGNLLTYIEAASGTTTTYGRLELTEPFDVVMDPSFPERGESTTRFPYWHGIIAVGYGGA